MQERNEKSNRGVDVMRKAEYINHLLIDNQTTGDKSELYADVIDCTEIALSQTADNFEIDDSIGLEGLFAVISKAGQSAKNKCVGPFQAAELIATKLGTTYQRATKKFAETVKQSTDIIDIEDFF